LIFSATRTTGAARGAFGDANPPLDLERFGARGSFGRPSRVNSAFDLTKAKGQIRRFGLPVGFDDCARSAMPY